MHNPFHKDNHFYLTKNTTNQNFACHTIKNITGMDPHRFLIDGNQDLVPCIILFVSGDVDLIMEDAFNDHMNRFIYQKEEIKDYYHDKKETIL